MSESCERLLSKCTGGFDEFRESAYTVICAQQGVQRSIFDAEAQEVTVTVEPLAVVEDVGSSLERGAAGAVAGLRGNESRVVRAREGVARTDLHDARESLPRVVVKSFCG